MKSFNFKIIFSSLLIFIALTSCGVSGKDPGALLRKTGLNIEHYEINYQEDNLERDANA